MTVQIIIEYKGKLHEFQEIKNLSEKDIIEMEKTVEEAVMGKLSAFSMDTGEGRKYFPKKVLQKSIISVSRINN